LEVMPLNFRYKTQHVARWDGNRCAATVLDEQALGQLGAWNGNTMGKLQ
jgi:hypothetical protein